MWDYVRSAVYGGAGQVTKRDEVKLITAGVKKLLPRY
jgi:hypothetical protein